MAKYYFDRMTFLDALEKRNFALIIAMKNILGKEIWEREILEWVEGRLNIFFMHGGNNKKDILLKLDSFDAIAIHKDIIKDFDSDLKAKYLATHLAAEDWIEFFESIGIKKEAATKEYPLLMPQGLTAIIYLLGGNILI